MSSKPKIAFLGLGLMGTEMARRLLSAGYPVTVYNRSAARADALVGAGASRAGTPRDAAAGAEIVITMLADDAASRGVWLGDNGALAGASRGALLIESSTVSVNWVKELAAAAREKGCELLDAPVTGSRPQAAAGELNFLVGGSDAAVARARQILEIMGKSITHLGPTGSGALVKLINNFVCGVQVAAIAEALAMIERTSLDHAKALAVLTNGAPGSPLVKTLSGRMTAHDFTPNFPLKLMAKDLAYAQREADGYNVDLATAAAANAVFHRAIEAGFGDKDFSAIVEPIRNSRG
jgi:3-hydroxyisobutyrate dehydrogenase